jgi:hypothetical protein
MGVTAAIAKAMLLAMPGVEQGTAYGRPAFKLRGKLFAGLRDNDTVLGLPMSADDRELFLEMAPEIYFITDHYRGYPAVLVRLQAIEADELAERIERAWRMKATNAMTKAFDAARRGQTSV